MELRRRAVELLVPAYWLIGSLDVAAALWLSDRLPPGLADWQAAQSALPITLAGRLEQGWMLMLLAALIAGSLGLLQQRNWGRWLFLAANIAMFSSYPLLDAMVYTWFGGLFADLSMVITGALLAIAFLPGDSTNSA
jgi:hypothetical protein